MRSFLTALVAAFTLLFGAPLFAATAQDINDFCVGVVNQDAMIVMQHASYGVKVDEDINDFVQFAEEQGYPPEFIKAMIPVVRELHKYMDGKDASNDKAAQAAVDNAVGVCVELVTAQQKAKAEKKKAHNTI